MSALKGTRKITRFQAGATKVKLLVRGGRRVFPDKPVRELTALIQLQTRSVLDAENKRLEVGFTLPEELDGSASAGWTDWHGACALDLENSTNLVTWDTGNLSDCPSSPTDNEDGTWTYWARADIPVYWMEVMVDYGIICSRYQKSITAITVAGVLLSLDYPYAMPSDAATLQADLRTAGFPGALVSVTTAGMTVDIANHTPYTDTPLVPTMLGYTVTDVTYQGSSVSLPSYPYAMPASRATLQADLRTAGITAAVVMLYGDEWEILLPDVAATGDTRDFTAAITPDDPHPHWGGLTNTYLGEIANATVTGSAGNVRTPEGDPLLEAGSQFFRMKISRITP